MNNILKDCFFDRLTDKLYDCVFEILPDVHFDVRGSFSEIFSLTRERLKDFSNPNWIKQINLSSSCSGTVRGCHAQCGSFCQSKLVQALNRKIYDVVTDARFESKTFGKSKAYLLDPKQRNQVWIPKGFLHAFVVPFEKDNNVDAQFLYLCDAEYNKESEIKVNPLTIIPQYVEKLKTLFVEKETFFSPFFDVFDKKTYLIGQQDANAMGFEDFKKSFSSGWHCSKE